MAPPTDFNLRSNEELTRLLYQNQGPPKQTAAKPHHSPSSAPTVAAQPAPEPLASRRVSELEPQNWTLGEFRVELGPTTEREERALFAALSMGTKANLGREPTVTELMQLLQRVNDARAFVRTVDQVLRGKDGIYLDNGRIVFGGSAQRRMQRQDSADAA